MIRFGFIGAPGCGKTVLAKRTSSELSVYHQIESGYVDEYASVFVTKYRQFLKDGAPSVSEQYLMLEEQLERERETEIKGSSQVLITDSPLFLNYVYASRVIRHDNPIDRIWLNKIHGTMIKERYRYQLIIIVPPRAIDSSDNDISKRVPGHLDPGVNAQIHQSIIGCLSLWKIPCITLTSDPFQDKVHEAVGYIVNVLKLNEEKHQPV